MTDGPISPGDPAPRPELPIVDQPPPERADAARNRRALLDAAHLILAREGVGALSMDRVAAEARVGVGTIYRRFGDRTGLTHALLDERERQFQAAFLHGPAPLGPAAPPTERIRAFLHAYLDRYETDADLHALGEAKSSTARYQAGAYQIARAHIHTLVGQARVEGDLDYLADALLATIDVGLYLHQRRERGYSLERIKAGVDHLIDAVLP